MAGSASTQEGFIPNHSPSTASALTTIRKKASPRMPRGLLPLLQTSLIHWVDFLKVTTTTETRPNNRQKYHTGRTLNRKAFGRKHRLCPLSPLSRLCSNPPPAGLTAVPELPRGGGQHQLPQLLPRPAPGHDLQRTTGPKTVIICYSSSI